MNQNQITKRNIKQKLMRLKQKTKLRTNRYLRKKNKILNIQIYKKQKQRKKLQNKKTKFTIQQLFLISNSIKYKAQHRSKVKHCKNNNLIINLSYQRQQLSDSSLSSSSQLLLQLVEMQPISRIKCNLPFSNQKIKMLTEKEEEIRNIKE